MKKKLDEIAPCTRCLHCHIGSNELNNMFGYCRVNAQDMLPNTELAEGIDGEVYCIGDCAAPFNIALAIRAGNDTGRAL